MRSLAAARSPATPLCSIPRAIAVAPAGGTVAVRAGRYPALSARGHSRGKPVTVTGHGHVVVDAVQVPGGAGNVRLDHLTIPGGVHLAEGGAHDVTISRSEISARGDAVSLNWGTHDVRIERNHISAGGDGIVFNSQSHRPGAPNPGAPELAPISRVLIRGNHLDGIGTDALRPANFKHVVIEGNEINGLREEGEHSDVLQVVMGGDDLVFRRNFVHDNTGQGFFIKDGLVRNARVEENVFVHNQLRGPSPAGFASAGFQIAIYETTGLRLLRNTVWANDLNVALGGNVRDAVVRGNLFEDMVADTDAGGRVPSVRQDYNLIAGGWNWGARGRHDISRRPRFVDPARLDYRLAPGSAGIDSGAADVGTRRDKVCRAPYDDPRARNRGAGNPPFADAGALERTPRGSARDTRRRRSCG
ncbi:MAG: hypothetical protein QOC68_2053 [Solirubrobacteraceae bacterium]|jgi:polygalacturonase|nr:hypothetical protein [Solirubrobacteraceae bacterium]